MKNKYLVLMTVIIAAVAIGFIVVANNMSSGGDIAKTFDAPPSIEGQPVLGDSEAPVTVVEFADYKCPSCKAWDQSIFPLLKEEYIDTGKVKFIHINTPFHGEESVLASLASEAVWQQNQDAFWPYHKEIYRNQPQTQQHDQPWVTEDALLQMAASLEVGIDVDQLQEDMTNATYKEQVAIDQAVLEQFNVTKTPTIMVNEHQLNNPFEYEHLVKLIEMEE
ncbi:DsbA family protein [Bacillaceae bacterium SIJ1]|uniref:DsbA family protein n=1 Tax=Litoribacterium kuwaitense TaxID=1398745 RepID=UPI0013EA0D8E|nr:DsbA family protein [Litoribacterium kuwaitense]NGP45057.1 DsbA family protein [Litoribacterium kuwaitense]